MLDFTLSNLLLYTLNKLICNLNLLQHNSVSLEDQNVYLTLKKYQDSIKLYNSMQILYIHVFKLGRFETRKLTHQIYLLGYDLIQKLYYLVKG